MTTVLVTGATDGIGMRTAQDLSELGANVIVHGRDTGRVAAMVAAVGGTARGIVADFTSLASVRAMADQLADGPLDVLINNAGTFQPQRRLTADGHEATWQVNHLAGALLTDLLLDAIAARRGRIVVVSAAMYARATMDLADPDYAQRRYDGQQAYGQSKLANVMYMNELVRRLGPQPPVTVNALHPGVVGTKLLQAAFGSVPQQSLAEGAASVIRLAVDDAVAESTGAFFIADRPRAITGPAADAAFSRKLYELTCAQLRVPGLPAR
jgi:NAD(P)-dependent dehydrogenase (short-subunit alcohol dehydrogenase family)